MGGYRFRLYAQDGDDLGVREFSEPNWKVGDTVALRDRIYRGRKRRSCAVPETAVAEILEEELAKLEDEASQRPDPAKAPLAAPVMSATVWGIVARVGDVGAKHDRYGRLVEAYTFDAIDLELPSEGVRRTGAPASPRWGTPPTRSS